jgi:hypothetical protein
MGTQNWMNDVVGSVYLSQLSIPGTHDTLTFNLWFILPEAQDQDQSFDIAAQLNAGIRYFDLRLLVDWSDGPFTPLILSGVHGEVIPNTEFAADILQPTVAFLNNNPSECVIFQLSNYGSTMDQPKPSWDDLLSTYINNQGPNWFYTANVLPTLDQVRGKIVLADASSYGTKSWGGLDITELPYNSWSAATTSLTVPTDGQPVTFFSQSIYDDQYGGARPSDQAFAIQGNINYVALPEITDPHKWYITSTNRADGAPSSKAFATGWSIDPNDWPANIGYNQVALNQINEYPVTGGTDQTIVGTVLSDFPNDTPGYIQAIIDRNPTPGGWTPSQTGWEALGQAGGGFRSDISGHAAVSWG